MEKSLLNVPFLFSFCNSLHVDWEKKKLHGNSTNGNDSPLKKHHLEQQRKKKIIESYKPAERRRVRLRGHVSYAALNMNLICDCEWKIDEEIAGGVMGKILGGWDMQISRKT